MTPAIVVMGVAGSGKSTIAAALAEQMGRTFVDADDFHSAAAVAKMAAGHPLDDDDRLPWLERLHERLRGEASQGGPVVLACSALRRRFRDVLRAGTRADSVVPIIFVHATGSPALLSARIAARAGHFMPATLLASQLATLEALEPDERGFAVDVAPSVEEIVMAALVGLQNFLASD